MSLARDDGGLRCCRPSPAAGENSRAAEYTMKSTIGIVLAFALGFACRAFGIPSPAPPLILGALLVMTMTIGYILVDGWNGLAGSTRSGLRRTERAGRVSDTIERYGALSDAGAANSPSSALSRDRKFGAIGIHPTRSVSFSSMATGCRCRCCCPADSECCPERGCFVVSFGATVFKCSIR